eukprot:COSAG01_NODE_1501_length_10094_cov_5.987113_6_plen_131_part_00
MSVCAAAAAAAATACRYFRGDTELHDLDTRLLQRMPETALRCLGVSHRRGNNRTPRPLLASAKFVSATVGRALMGGARPFHPGKGPSETPAGPPLQLAAGLGVGAAALAAGGSGVRPPCPPARPVHHPPA